MGYALLSALALCAAMPACASKVSQTGGETNWACSADEDCSATETCVEHRCVARGGAGGTEPFDGGNQGGGAGAASNGGAAGSLPISHFDGATALTSGPCADIDLAAIQANSGPPVSFRNDVMPIFGASCTASDCHKAPEKKADLYLGVRCATDPVTLACTFPDVVDPNGTSSNPPMPLTDQIVSDVYASVNAQSTTSPSHRRIVPGSPSDSFLVDSLMGTQNDRGYTDCVNQDPSHEAVPQPCGASMPLNSPALCEGSSRARFLTIARWIAQGAQNN